MGTKITFLGQGKHEDETSHMKYYEPPTELARLLAPELVGGGIISNDLGMMLGWTFAAVSTSPICCASA